MEQPSEEFGVELAIARISRDHPGSSTLSVRLHPAANIYIYRLLHNFVKVFLSRIFSRIYVSSTVDAQEQSARASPEQLFFSDRPH